MKKKVIMMIATIVLVGAAFTCGALVGKVTDKTNNKVVIESNESSENTVSEENSEIMHEIIEDVHSVEDNISKNDGDAVTSEDTEKVTLKKDTEAVLARASISVEPEFATPWKANSAGVSICIEGRGPEAIEEGEGIVYLKDAKGNMTTISFDGNLANMAPVYVEWADDNSFLMTMVNKYGRVYTGSTLYKVSVKDYTPYIVYSASENEEISEASTIGDDIINIKLSKYDDNGIATAYEKDVKVQ